jgi:hypothetical protein
MALDLLGNRPSDSEDSKLLKQLKSRTENIERIVGDLLIQEGAEYGTVEVIDGVYSPAEVLERVRLEYLDAADEAGLELPFRWLREWAQRLFTRLCQTKCTDQLPVPSLEERAAFLATMPPFIGAEHVTAELLERWWLDLAQHIAGLHSALRPSSGTHRDREQRTNGGQFKTHDAFPSIKMLGLAY